MGDPAPPLTYIQPTAQRQIEHMQTSVASYPTIQRAIEQTTNKPIELMQTQDPAPPNTSPQQRSIKQIQIQPIAYTQNQPIAHTQIQPIGYTQNQPIAHTQNQPITHTQNQPITHTKNQPIAH